MHTVRLHLSQPVSEVLVPLPPVRELDVAVVASKAPSLIPAVDADAERVTPPALGAIEFHLAWQRDITATDITASETGRGGARRRRQGHRRRLR